MKHPKFGDRVLNTAAGDSNPHKVSFFIRTIRSTGRMNPGVWYQCTDGKGDVWEANPSVIEILPQLSEQAGNCRCADVPAKALTDLPLTNEVMKLYEPPFKFQHGYIFDSEGRMVADKAGESVALRVRGWGRISYMPEPEKLQDAVGEHIAEALNRYWAELKGGAA